MCTSSMGLHSVCATLVRVCATWHSVLQLVVLKMLVLYQCFKYLSERSSYFIEQMCSYV